MWRPPLGGPDGGGRNATTFREALPRRIRCRRLALARIGSRPVQSRLKRRDERPIARGRSPEDARPEVSELIRLDAIAVAVVDREALTRERRRVLIKQRSPQAKILL